MTPHDRTAAARIGVPVMEYLARRAKGEKFCKPCGAWHPVSEFVRDANRPDGLFPRCHRAHRWDCPWSERDIDKNRARIAVSTAIKRGHMARASSQPCMDCDGPAEEHDHARGYDREHRLDVEPVCKPCHRAREKARRRLLAGSVAGFR